MRKKTKTQKRKYNNKEQGIYRSQLEVYAAEQLKKNGIGFEYEPASLQLGPALSYPESYERKGRTMKKVHKERSINYTPDFVGRAGIMETKGIRTRDFNIRGKLFKNGLVTNDLNYYLFLPSTKKNVDDCIQKIISEESLQHKNKKTIKNVKSSRLREK